ncbi:alpha/beta fold hydrolase [Salininema proteolyticum]|uniref:Alpha/beta fold hydrolase n=1 Tax=Salininema proteolyticum TaxID=1607685 RepID=A0ABV8U5E8_9ACTN
MDIILIAGLWLRSSAWDQVARALKEYGHNPVPVSLPGVDDNASNATLDDQVAAVVGAVDKADSPVVVGHSAASGLAWLAADRRPKAVRRSVMVGGFPGAAGGKYADFFPIVDGKMPFPGWEPFDGPDSVDLDEEAKDGLASGMVPVPEGVANGIVHYQDEHRFNVPVSLVCPEYSAADAESWVKAGDISELPAACSIDYVDIDSGHWPMITRPVELARVLHETAVNA